MIRTLTTGVVAWVMTILWLGSPAAAHTQSTGLSALIDGARTFWLEPTALLLSLGLSCLAVQQTQQQAKFAMGLLPNCWLTGSLAGFLAPPLLILDLVTTPGFDAIGKNPSLLCAFGLTIVGILVAIELKINTIFFAILVAAEAALSGIVNGLLLNGHKGAINFFIGEAIMIALFTIAAIGLLQMARRHWAKIAIRVIGSWITAASILLMGFLFRHPQ